MTSWLAALALAVAVTLWGRPAPSTRLADIGQGAGAAFATPPRSGARWLGGAVAGSVLVAAHLPVPVVGLAIAAVAVGGRLRARRRAGRQREARSAATVEVTFALAGELRAGRTPAEALAAVAGIAGPLRPAFDAACAAVAMGDDAAAAIAAAATQPGAERLQYVAAAWAVATSAGGRIAVVLEGLSEAMDDDDELHRELDAALAGPRATMAMLGGLPLLGLGLGQAVGAHPFDLLLHRPMGWALLAGATVLDAIGVAVTCAIAHTALRA